MNDLSNPLHRMTVLRMVGTLWSVETLVIEVATENLKRSTQVGKTPS